MFIEGGPEPFAWFYAVEVRSDFGFYNIKRLKSGRTSTVHDVAVYDLSRVVVATRREILSADGT